MTRREAREQAFMLVFEWEFHKTAEVAEIIQNAEIGREAEVDTFARELAASVVEHVEEIDREIENSSTRWKKKRIAKVSLAVLRVALGEMLYSQDIPVSVSINEAVEISKKYSTEADSSFVNGVLGAVSKNRNM